MKPVNTPKVVTWLPDLVLLEHFENDWDKYNDGIYEIFLDCYVRNVVQCQSKPVWVNRELKNGRMRTFWHITSEKGEFDRCKRIRWPKAIIENHQSGEVYVWENERKKGRRNLLFLIHFDDEAHFDHLVVLKKQKNSFLLITAYPIEEKHRTRKYLREYEAFTKNTGL